MENTNNKMNVNENTEKTDIYEERMAALKELIGQQPEQDSFVESSKRGITEAVEDYQTALTALKVIAYDPNTPLSDRIVALKAILDTSTDNFKIFMDRFKNRGLVL